MTNLEKLTMHASSPVEVEECLSEEILIRDMEHYEQEAARIGQPQTLHQRGIQIVYKALAKHRAKMLAALRNESL